MRERECGVLDRFIRIKRLTNPESVCILRPSIETG
jgi:hypothetical protein